MKRTHTPHRRLVITARSKQTETEREESERLVREWLAKNAPKRLPTRGTTE